MVKPAEIYPDLNRQIRQENLNVEFQIDLARVFLKVPGFTLCCFADISKRTRSLGKWVAAFPCDRVAREAKRLLPLIHEGKIKVTKFSNISPFPQETPILAVNCVEQDAKVAQALGEPGWHLRWKYNLETFKEPR